jgi:hypothetical protein
MQMLKPLAIFHIRLSPRNILDVPGIDQQHLNAPFFKNLEQRNPKYPSRFHGYGSDLAMLQPVSKGFQIHREGLKGLDWLRVPVSRNCHEHLCSADVNPSGVGLEDR